MIKWIENLYWRYVICGCFKHEWQGTSMTRNDPDGTQHQVHQCVKCGKMESEV